MITAGISKQIKFWQAYGLVAPVGYVLVSIWLHSQDLASWIAITGVAVAITAMTCIAWWHWSMKTMLTLMQAVQDSDTYWNRLDTKLADIQSRLE
jgi:hypothetical protein